MAEPNSVQSGQPRFNLAEQPDRTAGILPYLPRSLYVFALLPIVAVLQIIPITGIILMMTPAAFLYALIINGGMIALAVESVIVRQLGWLIIPALWFGVYEIYAWRSHAALPAFEKFVTAQNYESKVEFNQERHALVIENSDVVNGLWQHLLNDYAITEIFGFNRDVTRQRLANSPTCATMQRQQPKDGQPSVIPVREPKGKFDSKLPGVCWIISHEEPEETEWRVKGSREEGQFDSVLPYSLQRVQIVSPEGIIGQASNARATPYAWFPTPVFGCGLTNGGWGCNGGLMKESVQIGSDLLDQTTSNLGIRKSPLVERAQKVAENKANEFDYSDDDIARSNAQIARFVIEDKSQLSQHDLNRLLLRPDLILAQALGLAKAICRSATRDDKPKSRQISTLLRKLDLTQYMDSLSPSELRVFADNVLSAQFIIGKRDTRGPMWEYIWAVSPTVGRYCHKHDCELTTAQILQPHCPSD